MDRLTLKSFLVFSLNIILLRDVGGSPKLRPRMMIGQSYADTDNKFKHEVYFIKENEFLCSGSIISDYHILTAAHCVVAENSSRIIGMEKKEMCIGAGVTNLLDPQEILNRTLRLVEKIYVPKEFYNHVNDIDLMKGDIAVLKLNYKLGLNINPKIAALNIESTNNDVYNKSSYIVTGFGATKNELEPVPNTTTYAYVPRDLPDQLRYAFVNVSDCNTYFNNRSLPFYAPLSTPEKKLCGVIDNDIGVKKGICNGDSGGALLDRQTNTIVGVASTGSNSCDDRQRPSVYTNVKYYIKFIRDAVNDTPDPMTTRTRSFENDSYYRDYINEYGSRVYEITDH